MLLNNICARDPQGNMVEAPICKCGKKSDTCIMGVHLSLWICNECLYGPNSYTAKMVYKRTKTAKPTRKQNVDLHPE
jgi:hypothetical protein